jgi:hypothetical protein
LFCCAHKVFIQNSANSLSSAFKKWEPSRPDYNTLNLLAAKFMLPAFQDYYTKVMSESGFIADIYCCAINFAFELSLALWRGSRIWHPVSFRARIAKRVPGNLVSYSAHNPFSILTFKSAAPLSATLLGNILSLSLSLGPLASP